MPFDAEAALARIRERKSVATVANFVATEENAYPSEIEEENGVCRNVAIVATVQAHISFFYHEHKARLSKPPYTGLSPEAIHCIAFDRTAQDWIRSKWPSLPARNAMEQERRYQAAIRALIAQDIPEAISLGALQARERHK